LSQKAIYSHRVQRLIRNNVPIITAAFSFAFPFFIYALSLRYYDYTYGYNVLAVQYALWKHQSFSLGTPGNAIGSPIVPNVDTISYNGNYYNAYAPGLAVISLPFSIIGFILDGGKLLPEGNAIIMLELFVALTGALASFLVYKICLMYGARPLTSLLISFALAFSTSVWPFASVTFPHDTTMFFATAAVYCVIYYFRKCSRIAYVVLAGFCLGVVSLLDYVAAILVFPIAIYVIFGLIVTRRSTEFDGRESSWLRISWLFAFITFLVAFLLTGPLVILGYNNTIFGSPLRFSEEYYKYATPGQTSLTGLAARFHFSDLPQQMAFNLFSPYRGLLVLSPILILGFYGLYLMMRTYEYKVDALLFAGLFLSIFIPYSAWSDWAGGASYGPRFLVTALPFLVIPTFILWSRESYRGSKELLLGAFFLLFFVIGAVTQGMGALTTATPQLIYPPKPLVYQLSSYAIPELLKGKAGPWFLYKANLINHPAQDIATVVFIICLVIAMECYLVIRSVGIRA
jgi:hypothetical protein